MNPLVVDFLTAVAKAPFPQCAGVVACLKWSEGLSMPDPDFETEFSLLVDRLNIS